ncbi:MAG: HD domain-containing protein [Lachnospiraceae bacterium]|nr:HD domain-containing protein [Lachnospiraceae bacterium]
MKKKDEIKFRVITKRYAEDDRVKHMQDFIQHGTTTTYDHVFRVSAIAYEINHVLHLGVNDEKLIEAAVLHDYYLYDWHNHGDHAHGFHHPYIAEENARRDFAIDDDVASMIRTHMWPLNLFDVPSSRGAWVLTCADKISALAEMREAHNQKSQHNKAGVPAT